MTKRKRNHKGRFSTEYDWGDLIPFIIDEYIEGTPIAVQCKNKNYPSCRQTMRIIKSNPEFLEKYKMAIWIRYRMLDSDYHELMEKAEIAFQDSQVSVEAIQIMLKIVNHQQWNLERMAATYGVRLFGQY